MSDIEKTSVQNILRPEHLHAIGLVAAQWSAYELSVLHVLANVADNSIEDVLTLTNYASTHVIHEILSKYVGKKDKIFKGIMDNANGLRLERNAIVHSVWYIPSFEGGLLSLASAKAPEIAVGFGLVKSKTNSIVRYTPDEMFAVAKKIDDLETSLLVWHRERSKRLKLIDWLSTDNKTEKTNNL